MEWRRRNRNTYGRRRKSLGRRYADALPEFVNKVLDAAVAYYEEGERVFCGGSSEARLEKRRETLRAAIARLEGK